MVQGEIKVVQKFFLCEMSDSAKKIYEYPNKISFKYTRLIIWSACSHDYKPIEKLQSLLKRKAYIGGQQFINKDKLCNVILDSIYLP